MTDKLNTGLISQLRAFVLTQIREAYKDINWKLCDDKIEQNNYHSIWVDNEKHNVCGGSVFCISVMPWIVYLHSNEDFIRLCN